MPNEQRTLKYLLSRASQRSNSAQGWLDQNPILLAGEIGVEKDTARIKVGDGTSTWSVLPYWTNSNNTYTAASGISITNHIISATLLYDEIRIGRRRIRTAELYPVSTSEPLPVYTTE